MSLGAFIKRQLRVPIVGVTRTLQGERRVAGERVLEQQATVAKARKLRDKAQRELAELTSSAGARVFSSPEAREREERRCREYAEEWAARVAEMEAELERRRAAHKALQDDCRQAGAVAEALMKLVDRDEQVLREELDMPHPGGYQPPRVLTGRE